MLGGSVLPHYASRVSFCLAFNTAVAWIAIVSANRRLGVSNISVGCAPQNHDFALPYCRQKRKLRLVAATCALLQKLFRPLRYEYTPQNDRETLCLRRHLFAIGGSQLLYTQNR